MSPASSQVVALGLIVIVMVVGALTISAREAKGTITHQAKSGHVTVAVKNAYFMKGRVIVSRTRYAAAFCRPPMSCRR